MNNTNAGIGSSALSLSTSKIINLLLSMITAMLLSRGLSLEEYGTYSELQTVTSLVVSIFALGLPNCINYFLASCDKEFKKKFLAFYYAAITLISLVVMALMFAFKGVIAQYYDNPSIVFFSFFLAWIPWTKIAISSRSNLLIVESKIKKELLYSVANSFCLLGVGLLVFFERASLHIFLWLYVVIEIVFSLLAYMEAFVSADKKLCFRFDVSLLKDILIFSVPLGISTAISTLSLDMDKMIIGFFLDEKAVAIYANAGKELPFSLISSSFTAIVLPAVVKNLKEGKNEASVELWKVSTEFCFIILCFCMFASIVFAPQIITLLYSESYLSGVGIFRIYSLILMFRITYWGMILNAYGKTKIILRNSIFCMLANIVLSVALYYIIGFVGPALASLISIAVLSIFQVVESSRMTQIKISKIFPWGALLRELLINGVMATVFAIIIKLIGISTGSKGIIFAIALGILWAVIYFAFMYKRMKMLWHKMR